MRPKEIDERLFYRVMDEYFKANKDSINRNLLETSVLNIVRIYNERIKEQENGNKNQLD